MDDAALNASAHETADDADVTDRSGWIHTSSPSWMPHPDSRRGNRQPTFGDSRTESSVAPVSSAV